jgi:hypothetical protein
VADLITTRRLRLVALTPSMLRAVADGDQAEVERQLGARVGKGWEEGVPAELRLSQLAADGSEQPWLVRAMVASTPRVVVGSVGFHAPPDSTAGWRSATTPLRPSAEGAMPARGSRRCWAGHGRAVALAYASPQSVRRMRHPWPSSARSGFGMSASRSTRSTGWNCSLSGDCRSRPDRPRGCSSHKAQVRVQGVCGRDSRRVSS